MAHKDPNKSGDDDRRPPSATTMWINWTGMSVTVLAWFR